MNLLVMLVAMQDSDKEPLAPTLDLTQWKTTATDPFPFSRNIATFVDILKFERQVVDFPSSILSAKADVFVWSEQGSDKPFVTQLGGTPFVYEKFEWPISHGKPMQFLGSLFFGDSKDVLRRELPGDVLNLFWDGDQAKATWSDSVKGRRLGILDVPQETCDEFVLFGVRHRMRFAFGFASTATQQNASEADRRILTRFRSRFTGITATSYFLEFGNSPFTNVSVSNSDLIATIAPFAGEIEWPQLDREKPYQECPFECSFHITPLVLHVFLTKSGETIVGLGQ